jgi:hypothetical protein
VNGSKAPKWVPPRESEGGDVGSAETLPRGRRSASTVVETGWQAAEELPGVSDDGMSIRNTNESSEPLVGRLGAAVRTHSEGISYKPSR